MRTGFLVAKFPFLYRIRISNKDPGPGGELNTDLPRSLFKILVGT
jgi:hypothetical protein